jgi:hypothetical protein
LRVVDIHQGKVPQEQIAERDPTERGKRRLRERERKRATLEAETQPQHPKREVRLRAQPQLDQSLSGISSCEEWRERMRGRRREERRREDKQSKRVLKSQSLQLLVALWLDAHGSGRALWGLVWSQRKTLSEVVQVSFARTCHRHHRCPTS